MRTSVLQRDRAGKSHVSTETQLKTISIYQLSLPVAKPCQVTIAPVPPELRLGGDRHHFTYGFQFTSVEDQATLPHFAAIAWQFNDDGKLDPEQLRKIDTAVNWLVGGAL